jgi:hypothetical protein
VKKKTEPTPAVRALQADAREDYTHHNDSDTTRAAKDRQAEVRDNAAANIGFFGRRRG